MICTDVGICSFMPGPCVCGERLDNVHRLENQINIQPPTYLSKSGGFLASWVMGGTDSWFLKPGCEFTSTCWRVRSLSISFNNDFPVAALVEWKLQGHWRCHPTGYVGTCSQAPAAWICTSHNTRATLSRYSPWAGSTSKPRTTESLAEPWLGNQTAFPNFCFQLVHKHESWNKWGESDWPWEGVSWLSGWSNPGAGFLESWLMPQACQCFRGIWTMPSARCFNVVHSELFRVLVSHCMEKMLSPESSYYSKADLPAQKWVSTA